MKINGKVIAILPIITGEGKNGTWKSQDYVIQTDGQYAKKVCFNLFGDKIDECKVQLDSEVEIEFDIESREYQGKWYTSIKAWKCTTIGGTQQAAPVAASTAMPPVPGAGEGSNLPF